jgi:hypothetical protein
MSKVIGVEIFIPPLPAHALNFRPKIQVAILMGQTIGYIASLIQFILKFIDLYPLLNLHEAGMNESEDSSEGLSRIGFDV